MRSQAARFIRARVLRRELSFPEALLWPRLRDRKTGLTFRRQHPIGPYVVDVYCAKAHLVVEIDGESHTRGVQPEWDAARDAWFKTQGMEVLRVPAAEVLKSPDDAADSIWRTAAGLLA